MNGRNTWPTFYLSPEQIEALYDAMPEEDLPPSPSVEELEGEWGPGRVIMPGEYRHQRSGLPAAEVMGAPTASSIAVLNAREENSAFVSQLPPESLNKTDAAAELVILFAHSQLDVETLLNSARDRLAAKGTLWVCCAKFRSEYQSDASVHRILHFAHTSGMMGEAILPIDEDWVCVSLSTSVVPGQRPFDVFAHQR
ncbi:hypothetical protein [Pseudoduganella aquatica]|uniref:hypothetical protein n=1 Tax=Pseudoduganella aquatica TaxID=2660641 RepID=UPI001E448F3B|nr:hypothetical protein [Pseudoduganella aquatica]